MTSTGFIAEYDRRRVFAELKAFLKAWSTFFRRLPALRAEYADGVRQLSSIAYWREVCPATSAAPSTGQPVAVDADPDPSNPERTKPVPHGDPATQPETAGEPTLAAPPAAHSRTP